MPRPDLEQGQSLSLEQLHEPFEKALREGHLIPVRTGRDD